MVHNLNICLKITPNNILLMIQNFSGKLLYFVSAGIIGYKGRQKRTQTACKALLLKVRRKLRSYNTKNINICFKGVFK